MHVTSVISTVLFLLALWMASTGLGLLSILNVSAHLWLSLIFLTLIVCLMNWNIPLDSRLVRMSNSPSSSKYKSDHSTLKIRLVGVWVQRCCCFFVHFEILWLFSRNNNQTEERSWGERVVSEEWKIHSRYTRTTTLPLYHLDLTS